MVPGSGRVSMLNRLSVNSLLQSAIAVMAFFVVVMLAQRWWDSLERLSSSGKLTTVADAARVAFTGMHSLGGESSVLISNSIASGHLPPDGPAKYAANVGAAQGAWAALESLAAGSALPPALSRTMAEAKARYFGQDYTALRDRMFAAIRDGKKPEMTAA